MKSLPILALGAILFSAGPALAADNDLSVAQAKKAARVITPDMLRDFLTFIAADALQGRDTPSAGLDAAANFIAYNLKQWGAKPGGVDGTFFQPIRLVRSTPDKDSATATSGDLSLELFKDFVLFGGEGDVNAPVAYFKKTIGTADVKGKIVLVGVDVRRSEDQAAIEHGAVAVIREARFSGEDWTNFANGMKAGGGGRYSPESPDGGTAPIRIQMNPETFAKLIPAEGSERIVHLTAKVTKDVAMTQNVVAIVEGSDPKLKAEYVAIGAHYDHLGVGRGTTGDQIYNGADDDGSGTVSVLNIAEAFLKAPRRPKRSIIFVWHCGEEKGLWGSAYFNQHPTVPASSIVAQLNIDMIGRSKLPGDTKPANKSLTGPDAIYVIGTTMMSSRLGDIVRGTNQSFLKLDYDSKYDAPDDPNRFFYRSDHFNYAKNGIPICFWFDGEHEDYHRVTDEVSRIDFQKMAKVAQTVFVTAVTVADEPVRPPVDKPLPASRLGGRG